MAAAVSGVVLAIWLSGVGKESSAQDTAQPLILEQGVPLGLVSLMTRSGIQTPAGEGIHTALSTAVTRQHLAEEPPARQRGWNEKEILFPDRVHRGGLRSLWREARKDEKVGSVPIAHKSPPLGWPRIGILLS